MLKKRLIPKLQLNFKETIRGFKPILVLTRQFNNPRAIGSPLSQAKIYEAQLADELFLLDLTRNESSWDPFLSILEEISFELATPLSAGGGINSFEQVQELLERGADKVILNSGAIKKPELIDKVSNTYGSQCVVVCIDFKSDPDSLIILTCVVLLPLLLSLWTSFTPFKLTKPDTLYRFVGFRNYEKCKC